MAALGVAGAWVGITGTALLHREEHERPHYDIEAHGAPGPMQRFVGRAAMDATTSASTVGALTGLLGTTIHRVD